MSKTQIINIQYIESMKNWLRMCSIIGISMFQVALSTLCFAIIDVEGFIQYYNVSRFFDINITYLFNDRLTMLDRRLQHKRCNIRLLLSQCMCRQFDNSIRKCFVQYSSNEIRVHKVSRVLKKQLSIWSSPEIVALLKSVGELVEVMMVFLREHNYHLAMFILILSFN